jgi:hypothetical protein
LFVTSDFGIKLLRGKRGIPKTNVVDIPFERVVRTISYVNRFVRRGTRCNRDVTVVYEDIVDI